MATPQPRVGDVIKAKLPGESLWIAVSGFTREGRIMGELRNDSIHGKGRWGDPVTLGADGYTIEAPVSLVEHAEQSCAQFRRSVS